MEKILENIFEEIRIETLLLFRELLKKQVLHYNKKMVNTIKREEFLKYKIKRDIYTKMLDNANIIITTKIIKEIVEK